MQGHQLTEADRRASSAIKAWIARTVIPQVDPDLRAYVRACAEFNEREYAQKWGHANAVR